MTHNTLSKGDKVLCTSIGTFGDRFGQIAHIYGANLVNLEFSPGTAVDVNQLRNYSHDLESSEPRR